MHVIGILKVFFPPIPTKQHQEEEKRRKKEEAKARSSGVVAQQVVKFKVERRVSSDDLMLTDVSFLSYCCKVGEGKEERANLVVALLARSEKE